MNNYDRYVKRWEREERFGRWIGLTVVVLAVIGLVFVLAGGLAP